MNLIDCYSLEPSKMQLEEPSTSSSRASEPLPNHLLYLQTYLKKRWPTATIRILDHFDEDFTEIDDYGRYEVIIMRSLQSTDEFGRD